MDEKHGWKLQDIREILGATISVDVIVLANSQTSYFPLKSLKTTPLSLFPHSKPPATLNTVLQSPVPPKDLLSFHLEALGKGKILPKRK